ncbi:MAG: DUF6809 family protein [Acutalibacteraceae bacterium]
MTKTITQLWYGNLEPVNHSGKNNPEMKQLDVLIKRNFEKLAKSLGEKQSEILEKYTDCINEYITIVGEQSFCDGFCLGAKIIAEALSDSELTV